jgi:hypothetical protein
MGKIETGKLSQDFAKGLSVAHPGNKACTHYQSMINGMLPKSWI